MTEYLIRTRNYNEREKGIYMYLMIYNLKHKQHFEFYNMSAVGIYIYVKLTNITRTFLNL